MKMIMGVIGMLLFAVTSAAMGVGAFHAIHTAMTDPVVEECNDDYCECEEDYCECPYLGYCTEDDVPAEGGDNASGTEPEGEPGEEV